MKRYVAKQIKSELDQIPNKPNRRQHAYKTMSIKERTSFARVANRVWNARILLAITDREIQARKKRDEIFDSAVNPYAGFPAETFNVLK